MASKFYNLLESMIDKINVSVKSVNGVLPNVNGDVIIKEPINLLDNSDFRDPINQPGLTEYVGVDIPTIDRWNTDDTSRTYITEPTVTLFEGVGLKCNYESDTSLELRSGLVYQIVDKNRISGKEDYFTLAAKVIVGDQTYVLIKYGTIVNGTLRINYISPLDTTYGILTLEELDDDSGNLKFTVMAGTTNPDAYVAWAALYEGKYTADTLPEYKPKDRLIELAECYRYYRVFNFTNYIGAGLSTSEIYFNVDLGGIPMRSQPTVTMTTLPTTVYVEGATGSWVIDESTVALQNYTDGDTVLGVYSKSTKTATYVNKRATRVDQIGLIFDARS